MRKATISFFMAVCPSVCMQQLDFQWTDFHEIWYLSIFRISAQKIQVSLKTDKKKGYFTWWPKFFFSKILFIEKTWKNTVQPDRPMITISCIHIACLISKATGTYSENVTLIVFSLQQWLHERASMLNYTYRTIPVLLKFNTETITDSFTFSTYSPVYCNLLLMKIIFVTSGSSSVSVSTDLSKSNLMLLILLQTPTLLFLRFIVRVKWLEFILISAKIHVCHTVALVKYNSIGLNTTIFLNVAPCMLLHLLYNSTHALFTLKHTHYNI